MRDLPALLDTIRSRIGNITGGRGSTGLGFGLFGQTTGSTGLSSSLMSTLNDRLTLRSSVLSKAASESTLSAKVMTLLKPIAFQSSKPLIPAGNIGGIGSNLGVSAQNLPAFPPQAFPPVNAVPIGETGNQAFSKMLQ